MRHASRDLEAAISFAALRRKESFRPPAPVPLRERARPLEIVKALWRNPIEAWSKAHFEQPIAASRLPFADVFTVNDPAAIRRVLVDNAANYRKDHFQKRMLAVLSGGLLLAEREQWHSQRRIMAPVFTRKSVRAMASIISDIIAERVDCWRLRSGCVIDIAEESTDLALTVLERTIFAGGLGATTSDLRQAMRTYFDALGRIDPFDLLDFPDVIPRMSRLFARPAIRLFHQTVDDMIAARRCDLSDERAGLSQDILTLLMHARDPESGEGLTEPEIRANVITLMAAGHESTANAITWALYLLSRSSEWRGRVRVEAGQVFDGPAESLCDRLIQTRAVIEETLRLYPPLAAISRVANAADALAGIRVNAGAMIVIAPYVLHRHQMWGAKRECFDPARFLPGARERIDRYAYLPFGAGPRGCLGSVFAMQEATVAVAAITRSFDLRVAANHAVWPVHRITLRPRDGLPMRIRWRRSEGHNLPTAAVGQFSNAAIS